ncbi:MAG: GntR family transcriptional regulator [Kiritimatiellae bacterium]|nr:GntR family transcriptional regulator [Kiritimatiellia bacterium]
MKEKASDRVIRWLDGFLRHAGPGTRLPSDRELSERHRLSARTVRTVLKDFERRGLVRRLQGSGTFVPGEPASVEPLPAAGSPRQEVVAWVKRAIASGELQPGEALPPIKYLAPRFRIGKRTVIGAYRQLMAEGFVEKIGRLFWIGDFKSLLTPTGDRVVHVLNYAPDDFRALFGHALLGRAYDRMMDELYRYGFRVAYEPGSAFTPLADGWLRRKRIPSACVLHGVPRKRIAEVVGLARRLRAASAGRHLRVLLTVLEANPSPAKAPPDVFMVSWANVMTQLARQVARYCAGAGFRQANVYLEAKGPSEPDDFTAMKIWAELRHAAPALKAFVVVKPRRRGESRVSYLRQATALFDYAASYAEKHGRRPSRSEVEAAVVVTERFASVLEETRERPSVHIFAHDRAALRALAWARKRRLAVPADVSVVTLEDNPAFLTEGLAACCMDWNTTGYLMAHALIGDIPVNRTRKGFLRVRCRVIERFTARAARPCTPVARSPRTVSPGQRLRP